MSDAELIFEEKTAKKSDLYKEDTKLFRIEDINIYKIELSKKNKMTKKMPEKIIIYILYRT